MYRKSIVSSPTPKPISNPPSKTSPKSKLFITSYVLLNFNAKAGPKMKIGYTLPATGITIFSNTGISK